MDADSSTPGPQGAPVTAFVLRLRRRGRVQAWVRAGGFAAVAGGSTLLLLALAVPAITGTRGAWLLSGFLALVCVLSIRFLDRPTREGMAVFADGHLDLKDRMVSALEFETLETPGPYHHWQIQETLSWIRPLHPSAVLPWRWTRQGWPWSLGLLLLLVTGAIRYSGAAPAPEAPGILALSQSLQDQLTRLQEDLESRGEEELAGETRDCQQQVQVRQEAGLSPEALMEQMGRWRTRLEKAVAQPNTDLPDPWLAALGRESLTHPAAQSWEQGDAEGAAARMEEAAKAAAAMSPDQLASLRRGWEEALRHRGEETNAPAWSDNLEQLEDALEAGDRTRVRQALEQQSALMRTAGVQQSLRERLTRELAALGQMRQQLAEGRLDEGEVSGMESPAMGRDARDGGDEQAGPRKDVAGSGVDDRPPGDPTSIDVDLVPFFVDGILNEGDSERSVERTTDQQQNAVRDYREVYARYRKMSHAVIAGEALPEGYRRTIQSYFEAIRPRPSTVPAEHAEAPTIP